MAASQTAPAEASRLKVFLSYSRKDSVFAQELLTGLELLGFEAYLDKEDIAPGEPWEARLGNLIRSADTVVFVISPNSLASKHCTWEVEETVRAAKRLVPVVLDQVQDNLVPERIRKLNYVFFLSGSSFSKGLRELSHALRADAGWIREHTRLGELAARWVERGKPEALLLRGSDLEDARSWRAARPKDAPEISAAQDDFIAASVEAEAAVVHAVARRKRRLILGLTGAVVLFAGLSVLSGAMWLVADHARKEVAAANTTLKVTIGELSSARSSLAQANWGLKQRSAQLEAANVKLRRRLALRIAPVSTQPYDVGPGWYQAATDYAGAIGFIVRRDRPDYIVATGVVVEAQALDPRWSRRPVLITASYVIAKAAGSGPYPIAAKDAAVLFLGPDGERKVVAIDATEWQSETLGVSISSFSAPLPQSVEVLGALVAGPEIQDVLESVKGPASLELRREVATLTSTPTTSPALSAPKPSQALVTVGNLEGRLEVALSIHTFIEERAAAPIPGVGVVAPDLVYTKASLPGAGGSPVFDALTGKLLGIHLMTEQECPGAPSTQPTALSQTQVCRGYGTSLRRITEMLRAESSGH